VKLRPYQQAAVDAATQWMKKCIMPGLLELATGAGKSYICAAIADWVHQTSGKRVLCLQPSRELCEQNHEKYLLTGNQASIFSAAAGSKCMRYPVVYATPGTVKNSLSRFGDQFGAVILDEAHTNTPTIRFIIEQMRKANKNLRVIGMTGTPYRTTTGYIYQYEPDGSFVPEVEAKEPYFNTLIYSIQTRTLLDQGFLTPAHADPDLAASYDASGLQTNSRGQFDAREIEQVFEGRGRLTAEIIADVVRHSTGRSGVMIFAATVAHAKECMESLPPENSRMLGGDVNMNKADRERLVSDFKADIFKYVVSVGTLTTGFDATHVSVIAVLRATESPGMLQQIIGRGLRLDDRKEDCLVLDYADNIDRHGLHTDLFSPDIKVKGKDGEGATLEAECPECYYQNDFSARPNFDGFRIDENGYFLDLTGKRIETDHGPMPAHFGRRCKGQVKSLTERGVYERCDYRWTCKECPKCDEPNDIAARLCSSCKCEFVDPNDRLRRDFHKIKKDPFSVSTDAVLEWDAQKSVSAAGNETLLCHYKTEYRKFKVWYMQDSRAKTAVEGWESLNKAVYKGHIAPDIDTFLQHINKGSPPRTVTYYRDKKSDFTRVLAHNLPPDRVPG